MENLVLIFIDVLAILIMLLAGMEKSASVLVYRSPAAMLIAMEGIVKGDRILQIDCLPLVENFDLIYSLKTRYASGASIELRRDNKILVVEVVFTEPKKKHP
jgi:hypothetical protein